MISLLFIILVFIRQELGKNRDSLWRFCNFVIFQRSYLAAYLNFAFKYQKIYLKACKIKAILFLLY